MKVLTLPLKREFFDAIKAGTKLEEYRLRNDYWMQRLENRTYDAIELTLGYPAAGDTERRMRLPWRGFTVKTITHSFFGPQPVQVYAINVAPTAGVRRTDMDSKQDAIVSTWTANGIVWRELRVWSGNRFRYFVQREIEPGVWG